MLNIFHVPSMVFQNIEPTIILNGLNAQITDLCAGDIEMSLLFAAILSTWDRTWKNRIFGVIIGFLFIVIINIIRVFLVLLVGFYTNLQWADFTHDVLFRLTLIIVIVVYYYVWYVKSDSLIKRIYIKKK